VRFAETEHANQNKISNRTDRHARKTMIVFQIIAVAKIGSTILKPQHADRSEIILP
jgi:hypothetical protein